MKKIIWLCVTCFALILTGCGTSSQPVPEQETPDPMEAFDRKAKEAILNLDADEIERLRGQWENVQINTQ
jgi:starvation-inducible outer membrane lipoprotein